MKKIFAMFKGLPPEVRTMVAMAGLATPFGAIYMLRRFLFPNTPLIYIILGVGVVIGLLSLLGWLISRGFSRKGKKRSQKMADELAAGGTAGPVSMDVRAAIKANNEKFAEAVRKMRKEFGINVYDLPWYITIGDSGCGKTKLINEGGLTFSTGKPEGYQLGTLNYNFWLTEDAVFVDMAGRLCNPKDDADHREWQAFLNTIVKGRKGYPINGALVCVSAEHLLQDPAEKHEEDANTALERLRELQNTLGVTFATYLIITKCDKILGFMQVFDRAERDITIKNQIFGWSRPGDFQELYDPENFGRDFDAVYARLSELRLRRLNDDVDESELGAAYTFPEEFREMRAPLQTYVRTLFPFIKNPKAIKNLVFRGVYFTSATQQGSVILKHLTERLGEEAGTHFAPLESLYPRPRPHFIKDVLFRKVFPEQGLVFRNEQQVVRNRKLAKVFKIAAAVTFVVLASLFGWSFWAFGKLMDSPRRYIDKKAEADCAQVDCAQPAYALKGSEKLNEDIKNLNDHMWTARVLSLGIGAKEPIEYLSTVQAGLFEKGVLAPAISQVQSALRTARLDDTERAQSQVEREEFAHSYEATFEGYLEWLGCSPGVKSTPRLVTEIQKELIRVVPEDSIISRRQDEFFLHAGQYFRAVLEKDVLGRSPANPLIPDWSADPDQKRAYETAAAATVLDAIEHLRSYYMRYALIDANHPDPAIAEWMRLRETCGTLETTYAKILAGAGERIETLEDFQEYRAEYIADFDALKTAIEACTWKVGQDSTEGLLRIKPLHDAIAAQRARWVETVERLRRAYTSCEPADDEVVLAAIESLQKTGVDKEKQGLDDVLVGSLKEAGLLKREFWPGPAAFDELAEYIEEADVRYAQVIELKRGGVRDPDVLAVTLQTKQVEAKLQEVRDQLQAGGGEKTEGQRRTPGEWLERIEALRQAAEERGKDTEKLPALDARWRPEELAEFLSEQGRLIDRGELAGVLTSLEDQLDEVSGGDGGDGWGAAKMWGDYLTPAPSYYSMLAVSEIEESGARAEKKVKQTRKRGERRRTREHRDRTEEPQRPRAAASITSANREIPSCATRDFLATAFEELGNLRYVLNEIEPDEYLAAAGLDLPGDCRDVLNKAGQLYLDQYFSQWRSSYKNGKRLDLSEVLSSTTWAEFQKNLKKRSVNDGVRKDLHALLADILEHVAWAHYDFYGEDWQEDMRMLQMARNRSWEDLDFEDQIVRDFRGGPGAGGMAQEQWHTAVASQAGEDWQSFVTTMTEPEYTNLPQRFDDDLRPLPSIRWAVLREELATPLRDMWAAEQLNEVAAKGRQLLDREIDQILIRRRTQLDMHAANLPYGDQAFSTVGVDGFAAFLEEMSAAQACFSKLDADLTGYRERRKLIYDRCAEWRRLIGADEGEAWKKPLDVMIRVDPDYVSGASYPWKDVDRPDSGGPGVPPRSGPQNFYSEVHLCLGLVQTAEQSASPCVVLQTDVALQPLPCKWQWSTESTPVVKLAGKGRLYLRDYEPIESSEFGTPGKLSFIAFLRGLGEPESSERTVWRVGLAWDLPRIFTEKAKMSTKYAKSASDITKLQGGGEVTRVGTKFVFTLDRKLPEGIPLLKGGA
ncbi:MAG: hypothetical protein JXQ75_02140 [Phycisphaerae bacterium]|nr:hypothetical protein [Phycisphaerae bacterium]